MTNPVLVEITRSGKTESWHRGAVAIADAQGNVLFALGDVARPLFPRSSIKPIQALPLVESGAADAFGLGAEELALACASHSGEPMHTEGVAAWLARIGLTERDLACGPHPPRYEPVWEAMIRRGEKPSRLHDNCSGKHAGFLTVARHWKLATEGYENHGHPVQQAVARALGELAELSGEIPWGIDGCTAPSFALPLSAFARALAKFADPHAMAPERGRAMTRIVEAMTKHPELVAGTGRVCTLLMRAGHVAVKTGAEGFYAAIVPPHRIGIALKIDDGAGRAAETAIAYLLERLGLVDSAAVREIAHAPVRDTRERIVGERRPAAALAEAPLPDLAGQ